MAGGSKTAIVAALVGNGLIAVTKFVAAGVTGSAAMLSEAILSGGHTGKQGLLLYGLKAGAKPADKTHPFGHGAEVYFWTFVVAVLSFAVGAGVTLYHGVEKLLHPAPLEDALVNYVVLGLAIVFEAVVWTVAYRAFKAQKGSHSFLAAIRRAKDPTTVAVLFEDSAAMLGLIVAMIGVALADFAGWLWADGLASVLIGLILAATAIWLASECKSLLIGEAAHPETIAAIEDAAAATDGVARVNEILTLHLGPQNLIVTLSLDFNSGVSADAIEGAVAALEGQIKAAEPTISHVFIEAQSWRAHLAAQKP